MLKRDPRAEPFDPLKEEHQFYFWAGYRRKSFNGQFPHDLERDAFIGQLTERVVGILAEGGDVHVLYSRTPRGELPVGVMVTKIFEDMAWPHVVWFPEASSRNKLESVVYFLSELKKIMKAVVIPEGGDVPFFRHVCDYGVLRAVGTLRDYRDGAHATLFETT